MSSSPSRPSRKNGVHNGFDKGKQAVKMEDVYRIEKVWESIVEWARQHGDFAGKQSNSKCQNILKETCDWPYIVYLRINTFQPLVSGFSLDA